ncbi:tRNA (N6-threonylcarbamoyladenosine(37)-N6)-methyltransferase TrmO [Aliidiomarina taiwanensis]|uniref:tRNA (N6-threonylcarbamoyladenosine(37)-N6)-methyltransferase TrmO n=1 Tax=Aliidiomarina taiwanensis TaxID=946228 RepID=A0A432X973_9GAMM|nr:tRNA (N6-threonylcarbamoyladenosine(37)-N6)-methyltransferase TrmO [Aliidiomarina taiwanensis]
MNYSIEPLGIIESPYREKFAIPRQPGLVNSARGAIVMHTPYSQPELFRGIENYTHLWLQFVFHQNVEKGWQPLVRPPRLGGNKKMGVFATRSTFRPNGLGLSVVQLLDVRHTKQETRLEIAGLDLLHGTPIIDIKPYIPYADALPHASAGIAQEPPKNALQVEFTEAAQLTLAHYKSSYPYLQPLIIEVLQQDPRPAYKAQAESDRIYGMVLYDFNIKWQVQGACCHVLSVQPV